MLHDLSVLFHVADPTRADLTANVHTSTSQQAQNLHAFD